MFLSCNSEEIKFGYKSSYNKHKNQAILAMIMMKAITYYFAVKNLSEINSLGRLRGKKRSSN